MGLAPEGTDFPKDPNDFSFIFKTDDKSGGGGDVHTRVSSDLLMMMEIVVEQRLFAYRTKSDIIRDALWHRFKFLSSQRGADFSTYLSRLRSIHRRTEAENANAEFLSTIRRISETVDRLPTEEMKQEYIDAQVEDIRSMPSSIAWKQLYMEELKRQFGDRIKSFSLSDMVD